MTSPEIPPQPAAGAPRPVAGGGTATGTALALLVCAAVVAVAWLGAVHAAGASARTAVAWGSGAAGVVLCAAVALMMLRGGASPHAPERETSDSVSTNSAS